MHSRRLLTGADTAAAGGRKREHLRAKRSILFGAPSRTQNRVPREGKAVKCNAFDWGRDFCRFSPSVTPYGVPPADGVGLPLSLRDISPNRGISPTPTLALHFCFSIGTVKTAPYNFSLFIIHPFSGRRVMAAPLPLCRYATFPLTGESHRPLRTK